MGCPCSKSNDATLILQQSSCMHTSWMSMFKTLTVFLASEIDKVARDNQMFRQVCQQNWEMTGQWMAANLFVSHKTCLLHSLLCQTLTFWEPSSEFVVNALTKQTPWKKNVTNWKPKWAKMGQPSPPILCKKVSPCCSCSRNNICPWPKRGEWQKWTIADWLVSLTNKKDVVMLSIQVSRLSLWACMSQHEGGNTWTTEMIFQQNLDRLWSNHCSSRWNPSSWPLIQGRSDNNNSSPETWPNKGRNIANNILIKKLSYSDVSPKEWMTWHANLKLVSDNLPCEMLHIWSNIPTRSTSSLARLLARCACFIMVTCSCHHMPAGSCNIVMEHRVGTQRFRSTLRSGLDLVSFPSGRTSALGLELGTRL